MEIVPNRLMNGGHKSTRQTREPATVSTIAKRAERDPKTAQKSLGWWTDLGNVTRCDRGD